MDTLEIQPANITQVARLGDGRLVTISDDVGGVARDLRAIDRSLRLRYSPDQRIYVVYRVCMTGDGEVVEELVTTSRTCDQRIVKRIREISHPSYDYAAELDRLDAAADRRADHSFNERVGETGERLAHALRKDLGLGRARIVVPGD